MSLSEFEMTDVIELPSTAYIRGGEYIHNADDSGFKHVPCECDLQLRLYMSDILQDVERPYAKGAKARVWQVLANKTDYEIDCLGCKWRGRVKFIQLSASAQKAVVHAVLEQLDDVCSGCGKTKRADSSDDEDTARYFVNRS